MKRRDFVATLGTGLAGAFLMPTASLPPLPRLARERFVERWSWVMGQAVHLMVYSESEDQGLEACASVLEELRRLEGVLSVFDDASELSELNRTAGKGRRHRLSDDLWRAVHQAEVFRSFTSGAFNAAIEPLMRAWGFHRTRRTMPSAAELAEAREAVASATVNVWSDVVLPNSHTRLDLGGMAVGYAIDRVRGKIEGTGVRRAFIDVSGDCYGMGAPPGEDGWRVQVAGTSVVVRLRDNALATSSNRKSVIELENRLLGHVMDPARGHPVESKRQVTQVAPFAVLADYLSTASLVSGRAYDTGWPTYFTD
jgi:FAD:protein FMN transferase